MHNLSRSDISCISSSYLTSNSNTYSSTEYDESSINSSQIQSVQNESGSYDSYDSYDDDVSVNVLDNVKYLCGIQNYDVCDKTRKLLEKVQLHLRVNNNGNYICEYLKDHVFESSCNKGSISHELRRYFFKYYDHNVYVVYECGNIEQLCVSSSYFQHAIVFLSSKHSSDNYFVQHELLPELNSNGVLYTEIFVTDSEITRNCYHELKYHSKNLNNSIDLHKKNKKHHINKNGQGSTFWLLILLIVFILIIACYKRYRY